MARAEALKNNCTSGELTPKLHRHSDIEQYQNGLATCENGIVSPYGGVYRRFGFQFITEAKYADKLCIVRKFIFSEDQAYVLEIGDLYIRFYADGGQIINTVGTTDTYVGGTTYDEGEYVNYLTVIYRSKVAGNIGNQPDISATEWLATDIVEVTTDYLEAELRELRFEGNADVLYIFHRSHRPAKLIRLGQTLWVWGSIDFTGGPFLTENSTAVTLAASAVTGSGITVAASAATFVAGHVGSLWSLTSGKMSDEVISTFGGTGQSAAVSTGSEKVEIELSGTWVATVLIERSFDKGTTWYPYRTLLENIVLQLEDTRDVEYRLNCSAYTSGTVKYRLSVLDSSSPGYGSFRITAFGSTTSVTADVVEEIRSTSASKIWAESAWSSVQGYPRAGKIYEGRLVMSSTDEDPTGVWATSVFNFDDLDAGINDDDAFKFTLNASGGLNVVKWMESWQQLSLGTAGGEIRLTSSQGISASNPPDKKQDTYYGSAEIQAFVASRSVIFVDNSTRIVREYIFNDTSKTYDSPSISILAEHMFNDSKGILDIAYQEKQEQIIWCALKDGTMAAVTYKPTQAVTGWHHHSTQGDFLSVCTIPGTEGHDELWTSVKRKINGSFVRYIERMNEDYTDIYGQAADPIITPSNVYLPLTSFVTITSPDEETIRYTTDGTEPDGNSTKYVGPLLLASGITTVKAIVIAELYEDSDITTAYFQNTDGFQLDISYLDSDETYDLLG